MELKVSAIIILVLFLINSSFSVFYKNNIRGEVNAGDEDKYSPIFVVKEEDKKIEVVRAENDSTETESTTNDGNTNQSTITYNQPTQNQTETSQQQEDNSPQEETPQEQPEPTPPPQEEEPAPPADGEGSDYAPPPVTFGEDGVGIGV